MDLKWPLRSIEEYHDGVVVLTLTGRLGAASAVSFHAAVATAVDCGNVRVVVDLEGVDYISSAGLKALATAGSLCTGKGGGLVLCGLADPVRIALDLGGLLQTLPIESSREQAIASLVAPAPLPADEAR